MHVVLEPSTTTDRPVVKVGANVVENAPLIIIRVLCGCCLVLTVSISAAEMSLPELM